MKLNDEQKSIIILMVQKGFKLKEIAAELKVSYPTVLNHFKWTHENYKVVPVKFGGKREPYYTKEDDYVKYPTYEFNSLSEAEKEIYNAI